MDANKAVVQGASVKITNIAMGTTVSVVTNDVGFFQAPYLIPGSYRIVVEVTGFKKYVRDGIVLRVGDTREIDIQLDVGAMSQEVTVSADASPLETTSGSMGQIVDSRRVAELPTPHGDPFALMALTSGAVFTGSQRLDRPFEPTHIVGYAIDGTRGNRSDITIDGIPSTARANANEVIASYVPPTDLLQEFRVQTATFDASFGNTEGGVTNLSIKSGTNSFHGTAYFWAEPGTLAANDLFGNATRTPRPSTYSNRWGGVVGGPVIVPKLYNGRNRTFFLFGHEGIHDARPRNNGTATVPTAAMKNGDFSALLALGPQYQIYNPFTRRAVGNRFQEDPFPGNIIPQDRINPVSRELLKYFPDPLTAGKPDGTSNFQQSDLKERAKYATDTVRIDHVVSSKQRIFGRVSWYDRNSDYNNYFHNIATGEVFQFISRQAAIDDVYTFSATSVLNLRYGYNRFIRSTDSNLGNHGFDLTSVEFPAAYNAAIPQDKRRFPRLDITSYQGTGQNVEFRPNDTHSLIATLNKAAGAHWIKTGMEFRAYRQTDSFAINDVTGRFNFDSTWTRGPLDNSSSSPSSLGQSFAAFLLGLPSPTNSYVSRLADYAEQSTTWGLFVQDDWKVNRKLTLNLGLRYELEGALTERYNRSVRTFDYNTIQPIEAQVQAKYAMNPTPEVPAAQFKVRGGLTFAGVGGQSRGLYETPKKNLMPRFGFAYKLNDRTVMRGGFGIFFGFLGQRRGDVIQSGFNQNTNFVPTVNNGLTFVATLSNPFPNGVLEPLGATQGAQTFLGQSITFFNPQPLSPYMQRWALGIQHELAGGFVGEASYVGNRGTHIQMTRNLNATPQQYLSKSPTRDEVTLNYLTQTLPNPFFGLLPPSTTIGSSATITRERLLRPYPQFDNVDTTTNDGYSWYHSLQLRLDKRFSKGYTVNASYTFSKFMQSTEFLNPADPRPTEVISDVDRPHRLTVSGIYELPFGKGRQLLANVPPLASKMISGWQVSGTYGYQSGPLLSWGNIIFTGNVRDIALAADRRTIQRWFNADAGFNKISAQQLDHNVRTFPLRFGFLRGDRINNYDLTIIKNTEITETKRLQLRADFLNAFNHPVLPTGSTNVNGISSSGVVTNPTSSNFGSISGVSNQDNYSRRVQLGIKFLF